MHDYPPGSKQSEDLGHEKIIEHVDMLKVLVPYINQLLPQVESQKHQEEKKTNEMVTLISGMQSDLREVQAHNAKLIRDLAEERDRNRIREEIKN
jgi:uncharacterized membrane-anchored protein YhcB (DUF1043 family)